MIILIMGVAGSGKSTVGESLAEELSWEFVEGDRLHPPGNIEKMRAGQPLSEEDREPWLIRIASLVKEKSKSKESVVIAASLLRRTYRERIRPYGEKVHLVYLRGEFELIKARLKQRPDHFFSTDLLANQFAILEEPETALAFDASAEPAEIVRGIRIALAV